MMRTLTIYQNGSGMSVAKVTQYETSILARLRVSIEAGLL